MKIADQAQFEAVNVFGTGAEIPGQECSNEWLEPVDDEAYGQL